MLLSSTDTLDISELEHVTSLCPYLLTECTTQCDVAEVSALTGQLFRFPVPPTAVAVETAALTHDIIVSKLSCPFDDDDVITAIVKPTTNDTPELTKEDLVTYLTTLLFRAIYLRTMFRFSTGDADDEDTEAESWCGALLSDKLIEDEFNDVMRDYVILDSLHEGYAFVSIQTSCAK